MSLPGVTITETDGALGVLPASEGKLLALIGTSTAGPVNTPATYGRSSDIVATFGAGPLVEAAATSIDRYGKPVVVVRSGNTVAGTVTEVVSDADGTSVVTLHASPTPSDDFDLAVKFIVGGTRGVAGATYQTSADGGRTWGPVTALGTGVAITIAGAGGVQFDLAAGTFVAGDLHTARATAPNFNGAELLSALDALAASTVSWGIVEIAGPIDASTFDNVETKFSGLFNSKKYRAWIGHVRMPNIGESEATYLGAMSAAFASKATKFGALCAGACKHTSSVSGRKYRRPISHAVAAFQASVSEEIDIADVNLGSLPGVSIRDINGNPDEHDEALNPGLDDARFLTLRTHEGYEGVYITRPRLLAASGSDFDIIPRRLVLNLADEALAIYMLKRLHRPIIVAKATGKILESEARDIEAGAKAVMRARLMSKPKASDIDFVLSRVDNLLTTKTLNGDAFVLPLAYPEFINLKVGYTNPALLIQAV